jgi:hypothetical protein
MVLMNISLSTTLSHKDHSNKKLHMYQVVNLQSKFPLAVTSFTTVQPHKNFFPTCTGKVLPIFAKTEFITRECGYTLAVHKIPGERMTEPAAKVDAAVIALKAEHVQFQSPLLLAPTWLLVPSKHSKNSSTLHNPCQPFLLTYLHSSTSNS